MPEIIDWPPGLGISSRQDPILEQFSRSAGVGYSGQEQIVSPLSSRWVWRISVPIHNKLKARLLRTVVGAMKGRYNYLRIPFCDRYRISNREVGAWSPRPHLPHGDESYFSDGSGYALDQPHAIVELSASPGATVLQIYNTTLGDGMTAGVFFSDENDWVYEITNFYVTGNSYQLVIQPPLRQAIAVGDRIEFAARGVFRVDSDLAAQVELAAGRFGTVSLNLTEATARGA